MHVRFKATYAFPRMLIALTSFAVTFSIGEGAWLSVRCKVHKTTLGACKGSNFGDIVIFKPERDHESVLVGIQMPWEIEFKGNINILV
jgi:hypothetical protein